jgi:hypothetical protein
MPVSQALRGLATGQNRPARDSAIRQCRSHVRRRSILKLTECQEHHMNAAIETGAIETGKSKDERQADEEGKAETASKPGGFENDPQDPRNPNEARERFRKKTTP